MSNETSEDAPTFAVGATVTLNSGCMVMTVTSTDTPTSVYDIDYTGSVECSWAEQYDGSMVMRRRWLPVSCLTTYPAQETA